MLIFFFIIFLLYYAFITIIHFSWSRIRFHENYELETSIPFISIIIAVRNEEKNISKLLHCLSQQSITKDNFEVIVVDDHSEDNTAKIIEQFTNSESINLSLVKSDYVPTQKLSPKKAALTSGIERATGDIIVMTDGDCWLGNNWLESLTSVFIEDQIKFVSGPVVIEGKDNIFSQIQTLEFASLVGTGAALIHLNYPLMCNGANLAFRKSVFHQVGGYSGIAENMSGDDVFLMQKIHKAYYKSIYFVKDKNAIVKTTTQPTISSLIHQRKRWASKWNKYILQLSWALPVFFFIHYLTFIVGVIFLMKSFNPYWIIGLFIVLKFILDYLFLKKIMGFFNFLIDFKVFLLNEVLYPFYAIFFGIVVHFGNYQWKNRSHKV